MLSVSDPFVTGAAIMMLELFGARILAHYYETTLYVWSSMISVALVFSALGYFVGGKIADRIPKFVMLCVFIFLAR